MGWNIQLGDCTEDWRPPSIKTPNFLQFTSYLVIRKITQKKKRKILILNS